MWQVSRCGYAVLLMAIYWCTDAIPLAITAMLPVALLPLLGVLTTSQVCAKYIKVSGWRWTVLFSRAACEIAFRNGLDDHVDVTFQNTTMMLIGGMTLALAVEKVNLHKRIALNVLLFFGAKPQKWAKIPRNIHRLLVDYIYVSLKVKKRILVLNLVYFYTISEFLFSVWSLVLRWRHGFCQCG